MPYGILRFEKRRGGPASALEKHHERKKQQYASNPDIDTERSEMNFHLVQPRAKYYSEIQSRIEKAQKENPRCKVRKDSVKFIDTIVTASPEFFERRSAAETEKYFKRATELLHVQWGIRFLQPEEKEYRHIIQARRLVGSVPTSVHNPSSRLSHLARVQSMSP